MGPGGTEVEVFSASFVLSGYTFPAQDGKQWLDLTGGNSNNIEGVSQTVPTVQGKTYTLTFWVGNVSGGALGINSSVGLKINGIPASNFTNSNLGTVLVWQKFSDSFVAATGTTAIEFDNLDPVADNANALEIITWKRAGQPRRCP